MLPNLLLLGAQKSASTFFSSWLSTHPEIYIQTKEDISFEDPEYGNFNIESLDKNINLPYFGIKRPDYFGKEKYHERLYKHLPDAKIIIVLRHPVERAISAYYHYMKYGIISPHKPEYILNILNENFDKRIKAYENILEYGLYHKKYKSLTRFFNEENILLINQKEVIDSYAGIIKVINFLGVADLPLQKPHTIPQKSYYNWKLYKFQQNYLKYKYTYDFERNKSYDIPDKQRPLKSQIIIKGFVKIEDFLRPYCFSGSDVIPNQVISALKEFYKDDLTRLAQLNKVDINDFFLD